MARYLEEENSKLRQEISNLKSALTEIGRETEFNTPTQSFTKSYDRRERLKREIEDKINKGIYSPPKSPRSHQKENRFEELIKSDSDYFNSPDHETSQNKSRSTMLTTDSLQLEFLKLKASVEQINQSLEQIQYNSFKYSPKPIKDSFDSYYSDETVEKIPRDDSRKFVEILYKEIEELRHENQGLKSKMREISKSPLRGQKKEVKPMKFNRWQSTNKRRSKSPITKRDNIYVSYQSNRLQHCDACDLLLSHGFSTRCCTSHGIGHTSYRQI